MELINNKVEIMWKEVYGTIPAIDGRDEENHESISQNRNLGPPEYEAGILPTRPHEVV
jgi:hypothetical protein